MRAYRGGTLTAGKYIMNKLVLSALAGTAFAVLSISSAFSASCALGSGLSGACNVTGGTPTGTLAFGSDVNISGYLTASTSGPVQDIASGQFEVAPTVPGAEGSASVEFKVGKTSGFTSLFLQLFSDARFGTAI